jgi:hypothetical protein
VGGAPGIVSGAAARAGGEAAVRPATVARFTGGPGERGAGPDREIARALALSLYSDAAEAAALLEGLEDRARTLVANPLMWRMVEGLAASLVERGELTGREVAGIGRRAAEGTPLPR